MIRRGRVESGQVKVPEIGFQVTFANGTVRDYWGESQRYEFQEGVLNIYPGGHKVIHYSASAWISVEEVERS
jgi:hypothetical protein